MADNESNKRVICLWASFFALVVIIYIISFAIPVPLVEVYVKLYYNIKRNKFIYIII